MTIKDFANLFDKPCALEDLLSRKGQLSECDFIDDNILNGLLDAIQSQNKTLIDRQVVTKAIATYMVTTGDFSYFIRGLFKELLIKDGCSKEAVTQILIQSNELATAARRRNKEKKLAEKRQKEEALKKLEESIDMSKTAVSYDTARFLIRNGITYEELEKNISVSITSQEEIDPILSKYRIGTDGEEEMISIADIVGYDYRYMGCGKDLLKSFPKFFDSSKKDGYHTRSLSMLDLTTENVMDELSDSFRAEPIKVADGPGGTYTINGNGMHRYSVLRSLYLVEMMKANGNKEQEQVIRKKYTVPALVSKIDYVKTYSNFVLRSLNVVEWVTNERNSSNNKITGRVRMQFLNNQDLFLSNEELIEYVGNAIRAQKESPTVQALLEFGRKNPLFLEFIAIATPEMVESNGKENDDVKVI